MLSVDFISIKMTSPRGFSMIKSISTSSFVLRYEKFQCFSQASRNLKNSFMRNVSNISPYS